MATSGTPTSITVRVQAKGGKFLADDIGGSEVTIRDAQTGEWLAGGPALGTSSGGLSNTFVGNASLNAIVTPGVLPQPAFTVWWLLADGEASRLAVEDLPITRPTLLEISAFGPMAGLQSAQRVTTTQWIIPGQSLTQGAGVVVELPGLLVQVLSPATHLAIPSTDLPYKVDFAVNVTMMCGCQIDYDQPWVPSDFTVTAAIGPVGQPATATVPLGFAGTASLFTGSWQLPAGSTGFYQAVISAVQLRTGNTGTGTVTFFVKES